MLGVLTLTCSLLCPTIAPAEPPVLPWIEDDWTRAQAEATQTGRLIAVEVWATWCHSCLSMRNFVLNDKALAPLAGQHVWLALDFDKPSNSKFFATFPVDSFPTFLVIDPKTSSVVARWVGTGTVVQMASFFASATRGSHDPVTLGQRALAQGQSARALAIFEQGLKQEPGTHNPYKTLLLNGSIEALRKLDKDRCVEHGLGALDQVADDAHGMDFVATLFECASQLAPLQRDRVWRRVIQRLEAVPKAHLQALSADDRSGVYDLLFQAHKTLGNRAQARAAAVARAELLDAAAAAASTDSARATFDAHRLECDMYLGRLEAAEKMLQASEHALPADFNPPARLAMLYLSQGRSPEGLSAIQRALSKGYGGRRLRLYLIKVDLLIQQHDFAQARTTIAEAKRDLTQLSPAQLSPSWRGDLEQKLALVNQDARSVVP